MLDPVEFHKLTGRLLREDKPANVRAAVGRDYYALFLVARALLDPHLEILRSSEGHEQVRRFLLAASDATVREISSHLSDLRGLRNDADYPRTLRRSRTARRCRS